MGADKRMMKPVTEIHGAEFEREIRSATQPVLVHFYTSWCTRCRLLKSTLEMLGTDLANELRILEVNLDHCPELARRYGVMDVPELILFQQGAAIASLDPWQAPLHMLASLRGLMADYASATQACISS